MFRTVARRRPRARSFVSSVLLSRTWENESVADLRRELKTRGLPVKGTKATLILRIREHEQARTLNVLREPPVARTMSAAPGAPAFLNVALPDLWQPVPEPPVQIPYVPDFWDSSVQPPLPAAEEPLPKLNVVAGADTPVSVGPSHNLLDENAPVLASPQTPVSPTPTPAPDAGILGDITDDLGLPRPQEMKTAFWRLFS
ncbi:hypothetical protein C0993_009975 [Termitomyces sp. T159_Od127]|nr:hypothetical protein C0993_009975 [Termitomyces sp. T159_Od127]